MSDRSRSPSVSTGLADAAPGRGQFPSPRTLRGRTIALCITGSIAAYKSVELARLLRKRGASVLPVMTASATHFVGSATLAGITGESVALDMWDTALPGEVHVRLAERADLVAIVPATADVLARLAHGRADDLVTALALCARGPVLAAPAMHPRMWEHPATRRNVSDIGEQKRVTLVGPVNGEVASGDVGWGRMAEPETIVEAIALALSDRDLAGIRLVITAGPTLEDIDPVRFIGNRSTGRMGFAVAERAAARGADVTLIAGPTHLASPQGMHRVDVRDAASMRTALWQALGSDLSGADALVMAAAVADYRPAENSRTKVKKGEDRAVVELVKNPDLLGEIGALRAHNRPVLVGFAVETEGGDALIASARRKLAVKRVDLVVGNLASEAFGRDDNHATLVTEGAVQSLPVLSKVSLADVLLDRVRALLHPE
ncbi:MAG: bifunctional phosphopantothenoylcysteine decarboxylase/phosphopantothenate--cysteine ligase CoaBC [Myxococcota bacterium]|nr:bifunctional phosphopantothenoylcysteine decarboxylase/phosphopantothenate--cysteine ligase CoaBC [Myxococcota bacterium]